MAKIQVYAAAVLAATFVFAGGAQAGRAQQAAPQTGRAQSSAIPEQKSAPAAQSGQPGDQSLIDAVEKAYQAGVSDYRNGHLEAARANFDYAVDLMLRSGRDLKADEALSAEFDRIVDAVNTLEMDALREGSQLGAQHAEAAPVDVANDVTFPVDANVRAQAEAELKTTQSDLPLVVNDYVASYINFFSKTTIGHNTILGSLTRAGRYKEMILHVLKEEGVPQDLIYQAVAESGFRPQAVNPRSGAGGMWQFMPSGAYGLARTGWYDERFDPEKATHAYAREMKKAYAQLGDWYLAMAAYDWGTGNVQRAVQRTGYVDFWELYRRNNLPLETKNYVPIILAVTVMAKNPKQYGLEDLKPDPPVRTDTVTTDYAVDLRLVADVVNAPVQEIVGLNPSLLRMSTPPGESFDLHLPPGTKELYERRIAEIPEDKRKSWRFHVLETGETLASVAQRYHVSSAELAFVNQLGASPDLDAGDALVIPVATASPSSMARNSQYNTRRGDTLVTVADRFGVTVAQLKRWNHLRGSTLAPGRALYVAEPARIGRSARAHHGSAGSKVGNGRGTSRAVKRVKQSVPASGHPLKKTSARH